MKNATVTNPIKKNVKFDPKNPNAILDLDQFDYHNSDGFKGELKQIKSDDPKKNGAWIGEEFERYLDMLEELCPEAGIKEHSDSSFMFELHRAEPIMKERYPGIPNSPYDFVGIRLKVTQPSGTSVVHQTKIPIRHARNLNSQILNAHSRSGHGTYYLLKKN
jgi:hypothetical protein